VGFIVFLDNFNKSTMVKSNVGRFSLFRENCQFRFFERVERTTIIIFWYKFNNHLRFQKLHKNEIGGFQGSRFSQVFERLVFIDGFRTTVITIVISK
jgi:hypothetical protein